MALSAKLMGEIQAQAEHSFRNAAPATARLILAQLPLAQGESQCGRRIANWPGNSLVDAMALRFTGGLHSLYLSGKEPALGGIYSGEIDDQAQVDALVAEIVSRHDVTLLPWFDGPPQTNEAGRSASFIAALHWLASRAPSDFELLEIGSSAGMNLLIDRLRYDLSGVIYGPDDAPVTIRPEWRGPPPPADSFNIVSVRGCDLAPVDIRDPDAANRLRAYIWPEAKQRFTRLDAAIAMIHDRPVDLVQADAADWIEAQLAMPQGAGTTRVLMHSIVWQYIPVCGQARITAAMEGAGLAATATSPLAWIALETNRATFRHELKVRHWPGDAAPILLGEAHAHGAWVEWLD